MRTHVDARAGPSMAPGDRIRRPALLLAILAAHFALLLWLAHFAPTGGIARRADDGLVTVSLTDPGGATISRRREPARARTAATAPVAVAPPMRSDAAPPPPAATEAGAGAGATIGGGCALASDSGQAIARDPLAMAELDALPAGVRSLADAVMLWNGQWLGGGAVPAAAGGALRRVVQQVVLGAPPECRDAQNSGPRFVPVSQAGRTVMIVIGSGSWRWADLLAPPAGCSDASPADCPESRPADADR